MKRFEDIEAWQFGVELAVEVYKLTGEKSFNQDWGFRDQMRRAAISISANIAEGFERNSTGDFNRYVLITKGSYGELRTHLIIAERIGYITGEESARFLETCHRISAMLSGLSKYLTSLNPSKITLAKAPKLQNP